MADRVRGSRQVQQGLLDPMEVGRLYPDGLDIADSRPLLKRDVVGILDRLRRLVVDRAAPERQPEETGNERASHASRKPHVALRG